MEVWFRPLAELVGLLFGVVVVCVRVIVCSVRVIVCCLLFVVGLVRHWVMLCSKYFRLSQL